MKKRYGLRVSIGVIFAVTSAAHGTPTFSPQIEDAPRSYTITEIILPAGDVGIEPRAINDRGVVVGYVQSVGPEPKDHFGNTMLVTQAFLWRYGILTLPFASLKSRGSDVVGINDEGDILGSLSSDQAGGHDRYVLLRGGREYLLLPPYKSFSFEASALDDEGQVVGSMEPFVGSSHACLWQMPGKKPVFLHGATGAFCIDRHGRIGLLEGKTVDTESSTCKVYQYEHGRLRRIGPRSGFPRVAPLATSGSGDMLIKASTSDWYQVDFDKTFLWSEGVLRELPQFGSRVRDNDVEVSAMNDASMVVGRAYRSIGLPPHEGTIRYAFRFDCRTGRYADLNSLVPQSSGWTLEQATGINDRGQIVGVGRHGGKEGAFLLTPPENKARNSRLSLFAQP